MLQEAREILERYGENIAEDGTFTVGDEDWNYLQCYPFNAWWLGDMPMIKRDIITLPELEQLLKQNRNDNTSAKR